MSAAGTGATLDAVSVQLETIFGVEFRSVAWWKFESPWFSGMRVHLISDRPMQPLTAEDGHIDIEVPGVLLADIATTGTHSLEMLLVNDRG